MSSVRQESQRSNYGNVNFDDVKSKVSGGQRWFKVEDLNEEMLNMEVLLSGRVVAIRGGAIDSVIVVLRDHGYTVQCVASDKVSRPMVNFATGLSTDSIIVVDGLVSVPVSPIKFNSQKVEVQIRRIYCINLGDMPTEDAARTEVEIQKALQQAVNQSVRVNQRIRVLGLRTPVTQAIFRLQGQIENEFRRFLLSEDFVGIHPPELISGSSEVSAVVCLAPHFYKQMAICGYMGRVFEIGPVFKAERSFSRRHLCEFIGLDVEMEIKEHYSEVMDVVDRLFVAIFDHLNQNCKKELEGINKKYPFEPLKYLTTTLRLAFEEGVKMLKASGVEVDPFGDLSTQAKQKLGQLVLEKYDTEFYILHRCPLAVRPFYTMPCEDNYHHSNSFSVFMRGEEIASGGQRVHDVDLLSKRAEECGIDVNTISTYLNTFRNCPPPPHCGFGFGLEQFMMLFCNLAAEYDYRFKA